MAKCSGEQGMKALFVGLGSIGQRHLRNLRKLKPNIDLIAVRSTRSAPALSETNQVISDITVSEKYKIKEFDSLQLALEQQPDLVFVTNPTSLHLGVAYEALSAGCYVFIEKPLSHTWEGVEDLIKAEKESEHKKIAIGYQFRFHPALLLVKKALNEKRIGRLIGAQLINGEYMPGWHPYEDYRISYAARRDLGGGALVTQIHDFDNAMWLFGYPEKLFAIGGQLSELEIDVEDSVQVLMQCKEQHRKFPVTINLNYLQWPPRRTISIVGDKGTIQCDLINMEVTFSDCANKQVESHSFSDYDRNQLFIDEMNNFLEFAAGKKDSVVDLECGVASLRIAIAARDSMESGNIKFFSWGNFDPK